MQTLLLKRLSAGTSPVSSSQCPEPTGQAVLSWAARGVLSQPCSARAALAPGSEQLNEVLSLPSWEWGKARCCFLMLLFYFAAASPSRCLSVTNYFTAVRAWEGGAEGEVKNLASASSLSASIPDAPAAAQTPEAGRDGWQVHLLGSWSHAQVRNKPAMVC